MYPIEKMKTVLKELCGTKTYQFFYWAAGKMNRYF